MFIHKPVLLNEVLKILAVQSRKRYIDATVGEGGHALAIAQAGGKVLGIDRDPEILKKAGSRMQEAGVAERVRLVRGNFREIDRIADKNGFTDADGVLMDLGVSSWQLEESGRGFTFQKEEPLDMRTDPHLSVTAADLLNGLTKNELTELFQKFGEEERAWPLASSIVSARTLKPFETTGDLVKVVAKVKGSGCKKRVHPATKVFQALRIAVNDEVENLRSALPRAFGVLQTGGRLVVISFHSLEDREVKRFLREQEKEGLGAVLTEKPIRPAPFEVSKNPRSRSARLRSVEKK
ncbi:MAG: 16S rRNA (cytosine(1402)-N(4))-methyltransferase RsmH [Patescibacteria group bacterium]|nr:MAG: 16S rRNA (cytosine(1402)-N(4))-methyltransferase RsmH [Patescibacteria group bacterium]